MEKQIYAEDKLPGILYSHLDCREMVGEQFVIEHGVCYMFSGVFKVADAMASTAFRAGEMLFFRKNFLAKFVKHPEDGVDFRSIAVVFDREFLLEFNKEHGYVFETPYPTNRAVLKLEPDILIKNFFETLAHYFDSSLHEHLAKLKKKELLLLLLQLQPELKNVFFDFSIPGKIDLEAFMQQNYRFNVDMKRLAFLTGRSLATFKRDFQKTFHTTPNRWLQQRRLEEAHYLLKEKQKRPSDVYQEVGFESLSHFSYAFKQFFGVNPSSIH